VVGFRKRFNQEESGKGEGEREKKQGLAGGAIQGVPIYKKGKKGVRRERSLVGSRDAHRANGNKEKKTKKTKRREPGDINILRETSPRGCRKAKKHNSNRTGKAAMAHDAHETVFHLRSSKAWGVGGSR